MGEPESWWYRWYTGDDMDLPNFVPMLPRWIYISALVWIFYQSAFKARICRIHSNMWSVKLSVLHKKIRVWNELNLVHKKSKINSLIAIKCCNEYELAVKWMWHLLAVWMHQPQKRRKTWCFHWHLFSINSLLTSTMHHRLLFSFFSFNEKQYSTQGSHPYGIFYICIP